MISLLIFLTCIFYLNFLSRIIISPLLPYLERSMSLSHSQSASFFMLISAGYFIAILCSGFISSRAGHKNTIVFSAFAIACSTMITSFATSLPGMRAGFCCMGLAAGLYLPSAVALISAECPAGTWGRAFSVHELAPNLAFITAPFIVAGLLGRIRWQSMFQLHSILLAAVGIAFYIFSRGSRHMGTSPDLTSISSAAGIKGMSIMTAMFCMGILGTLGIYNMLPLFLVDVHGMSEVSANSIIGLSRVATLGAALAGGWISDRLGAVITMGWVLRVSGILVVLMGAISGNMLYVCVFLQPVVAVCFFPAAFASLSSLAGPDMRNIVISLVIPLAYVTGGGAIPWLIGFLADMGHFSAGIAFAGLLMTAGSFLVFSLET